MCMVAVVCVYGLHVGQYCCEAKSQLDRRRSTKKEQQQQQKRKNCEIILVKMKTDSRMENSNSYCVMKQTAIFLLTTIVTFLLFVSPYLYLFCATPKRLMD